MADRYEAASQLTAYTVSRETIDDLDILETRLKTWARKIDLVADSTLDDIWTRHVLDSLQIWPLAKGAKRWLDIGSGGGFPGLVVGILLKNVTDGRVTLVESRRKRAAFLQTITGELNIPALIKAVRIETLTSTLEGADIVTARAVAPLDVLLGLSRSWLSCGSTGLFHKGRTAHQEVDEARRIWSFDLDTHKSLVDRDGVILEIRNLRPIDRQNADAQ